VVNLGLEWDWLRVRVESPVSFILDLEVYYYYCSVIFLVPMILD
jgi:hypothetical protein